MLLPRLGPGEHLELGEVGRSSRAKGLKSLKRERGHPALNGQRSVSSARLVSPLDQGFPRARLSLCSQSGAVLSGTSRCLMPIKALPTGNGGGGSQRLGLGDFSAPTTELGLPGNVIADDAALRVR